MNEVTRIKIVAPASVMHDQHRNDKSAPGPGDADRVLHWDDGFQRSNCDGGTMVFAGIAFFNDRLFLTAINGVVVISLPRR